MPRVVPPPLQRLAMALALAAVAPRPTASSAYMICVVIEEGFTMLLEAGTDPVTVTSDAQLRGFDVDMRALSLQGANYSIRVLQSYGELQVRTRNGECDVGWGQFFTLASRKSCVPDAASCRPLAELDLHANGSIASAPKSWEPYRCCASYSPNLFPFSIHAMHRAEFKRNGFFASFLAIIQSAFFINFLSFSFLVGCIFSHAVWFFERHTNSEQFPFAYFDGVDDSVWWAAATFTTVGYGDKTPKTPLGRMFAVAWMLLGVTLCSVLSGHMATSFYEKKNAAQTDMISKAEDLAGLRVCGYPATFKSWYLPASIQLKQQVLGDNVAHCGALLQAGDVDAVVMDSPVTDYWMRTDPWAKSAADLVLSPVLATVPIGQVYSKSSDIGPMLDLKFLELFESVTVRDMHARWFGRSYAVRKTDEGDSIDWWLCGPTLFLLMAYTIGLTAYSLRHGENPCAAHAAGAAENVQYSHGSSSRHQRSKSQVKMARSKRVAPEAISAIACVEEGA